MRKLYIAAAIVLAAALLLGIFSVTPIIIAGDNLPDGYSEAIRSQAGGVYSPRLPLVPVFVTISDFSEEIVYYTIHYFPFGTVGISYSVRDGYNMEKHLIHS